MTEHMARATLHISMAEYLESCKTSKRETGGEMTKTTTTTSVKRGPEHGNHSLNREIPTRSLKDARQKVLSER